MPATPQNKTSRNIFLRMHPLQRIVLSLGVTILVYALTRNSGLNGQLMITLLWDVFSLSFIFCSWVVFFKQPVAEIVKQANKEDGSKLFVLIAILLSSFGSMFTVMQLIISADQPAELRLITVILAIAGIMLSWIMVHTIFTFHYAHMYYFDGADDTPDGESLEFPGDKKPDYLDFAYFSFVIGMTFQVSDVQISSRIVRRTVLAHSLLAFALNTFVVALTINLIAGLKSSSPGPAGK